MIGATVAHLDSKRAGSMNRCLRTISIAVLLFAGHPNVAVAGMPSVTLSDLARMRFQTISFFLVVFLAVFMGRPLDLELGAKRLPAASVPELSPSDHARRALGTAVPPGPDDDLRRPRVDDSGRLEERRFHVQAQGRERAAAKAAAD